jgi:hypothetical protein
MSSNICLGSLTYRTAVQLSFDPRAIIELFIELEVLHSSMKCENSKIQMKIDAYKILDGHVWKCKKSKHRISIRRDSCFVLSESDIGKNF